jgi:hypothetical protein
VGVGVQVGGLLGLAVLLLFGVIDGLVGLDLVLVLDGVDDVVGDGPGSTAWGGEYLSLSPRISSWSNTSRFFMNYRLISCRTAAVFTGWSTIRLASFRQSRKISSVERFSISCVGFIYIAEAKLLLFVDAGRSIDGLWLDHERKYQRIELLCNWWEGMIEMGIEVSYKNSDGGDGEDDEKDHGEVDVLPTRSLLRLIGLTDVLPCLVDVAVGVEEFIADDVQLFALPVDQHCRLLHDVVHVHDALGDHVDLLVPLMDQLPLHLELHLHFLLAMGSLLAVLRREPTPRRPVAPVAFLLGAVWYGRGRGRWGGRVVVIGGLQELLPAIALDAELLLGGADLACGIGVEVGLFELLNEVFDVGSGVLDEGLFASEAEDDGLVGVDADGPVEVVVAVLQLFYQRDGLLVGRTELPAHVI